MLEVKGREQRRTEGWWSTRKLPRFELKQMNDDGSSMAGNLMSRYQLVRSWKSCFQTVDDEWRSGGRSIILLALKKIERSWQLWSSCSFGESGTVKFSPLSSPQLCSFSVRVLIWVKLFNHGVVLCMIFLESMQTSKRSNRSELNFELDTVENIGTTLVLLPTAENWSVLSDCCTELRVF